MRRLFWSLVGIGIGAVIGVAAVRWAQRARERYSPSGIARRVGSAGEDLAARLAEAIDEGRRSMAVEEARLRAQLGLDRG